VFFFFFFVINIKQYLLGKLNVNGYQLNLTPCGE